jgi:hypothetical protein
LGHGAPIAHELAEDLGFEAQDMGPLKQSYLLEVLASHWGSLAYGQKLGRGIGFRLLRRVLKVAETPYDLLRGTPRYSQCDPPTPAHA